jgi:hypothetical protein
MDEEKQKGVLDKMEQFLDVQRQFWYPDSEIVYKRKSAYCSFSEKLKREILYAGYSVNEFLSSLAIDVSSDRKKLDVSFSYKSGDTGIALPDQSILQILLRRGDISNVDFRNEENEPPEKQTNFEGNAKYQGKTLKVVGSIKESKLSQFTMFEGEEHIFRDEVQLKNWIMSIISEWLEDVQPVEFEWSSHRKPESHTHLLKILKEVSEIGIDASSEEETHVFRWREESFADQCKSSSQISKQDVEDIIKKSGLQIPKDAELTGLGPHGENTTNPCLRAIYTHTIPDDEISNGAHAEIPSEIPSVYRNAGKITIEGDFCIFHIDPENRRVFS